MSASAFYTVKGVRRSSSTNENMPARWTIIRNALHSAIEDGDEVLACSLINSGTIDLEERTTNTIYNHAELDEKLQGGSRKEVGRTPLHLAARYGRTKAIRALLEHDVDIEACDDGTWTALHLACGHGNFNAALALVEAGADINSVEEDGWQPVHQACVAFMSGEPRVLELMLQRGADVSAETFDGYGTPFTIADGVADPEVRESMLQLLGMYTPTKSTIYCELCWNAPDMDDDGSMTAEGTANKTDFWVGVDGGYNIFDNIGECEVCGIDTNPWKAGKSALFGVESQDRKTRDASSPNRSRYSSRSSRDLYEPRLRLHQYRKLRPNSIRLLVLNPGTADEPMECYLEHFELEKCPKYIALSYTWGTDREAVEIRLDGARHYARQNLFDFLRTYRDRYDTSLLWIDAVCINQNDDIERAAQVQLMNRIYGCADLVLVWLGTSTEKTFQAMRCMKKMVITLAELVNEKMTDDEDSQQFKSSQDDNFSTSLNKVSKQHALAVLEHEWDMIRDIYDRPWWSRIWVHQEVTATTPRGVHLMCGPHTINFEEAVTVNGLSMTLMEDSVSARPLQQIGSETLVHMGRYTELRAKYKETGTSNFMKMYDLLFSLRDYQATDARDKLFALIPLSTDGNEILDVDYAISIEDTYCSAAIAFIQHFRDLDILSYCAQTPGECDSTLSLPSWVPDWTQKVRPIRFFKRGIVSGVSIRPARVQAISSGTTTYQIEKLYNASLGSETELHMFDSLNRKMTCKGFVFDKVQVVTDTIQSFTNMKEVFPDWDMWLAQQLSIPPTDLEYIMYPVPVSTLQVEIKTTLTLSESVLNAYDCTLHANSEEVEIDVARRSEPKLRPLTRSNHGGQFYHGTYLRKLFITSSGYIGLTSHAVEPGDLVVVLCGGQMPFVLRKVKRESDGMTVEVSSSEQQKPQPEVPGSSDAKGGSGIDPRGSDESEHYILLGEAYVHGIMDGEAVKMQGTKSGIETDNISMKDLNLDSFEIW